MHLLYSESSLRFASPGWPFLRIAKIYISFNSESREEQDGILKFLLGATVAKLWPNLECNGDEKDKGRFLLYL